MNLTRFGASGLPPSAQASRQAKLLAGRPLLRSAMATMYNIDDYDLKILTLLQANGRLTNQELSELIGLSASQCSRRRIALEQAQLILGYHARLAPDAAGQEMLGLIEVRLLNHTPQCVESFHQMLSEVDAILDAWKTTGDADYLLRVTVPDLPGLSHLISHILAQNKGWPI